MRQKGALGPFQSALLIGLTLLLALMFYKSESIDYEAHAEFPRDIAKLRELDAALNDAVTLTRYAKISNYDPIVAVVAETSGAVLRARENLPAKIAGKLDDPWRGYTELLVEKISAVEDFKSDNAVLRNSSNYLPVIVGEFLQIETDDQNIKGIQSSVDGFLMKVLLMRLDRGYKHVEAAQLHLSQAEAGSANVEGAVREILGVVLLHGESVMENGIKVDNAMSLVLEAPISGSLGTLVAAYHREFAQLQTTGEYFRLGFFLVSISLSMIVAVILFQLNKLSRRLRNSLTELNFQKYAMDQHAIVSITDVEGRITYSNNKFTDVSGYERETLNNSSHRILNSGYHSPKFFKEMWQTIAKGDVWHGEIRNRAKDGRHYWVQTSIVPSLDESGKPFQYVAIDTNVTDQKELEQDLAKAVEGIELANEELEDRVRVRTHELENGRVEAETANAAKSEFLSSMSHELRTPLNAVIGFGQLLQSDQDDSLSKNHTAFVDRIVNGGQHLLGWSSRSWISAGSNKIRWR
jgi:two-component system sensor histidine kinase/response regulator